MDLIKKMCGSFDFTAISSELYALLPQDKMDVERAKKRWTTAILALRPYSQC